MKKKVLLFGASELGKVALELLKEEYNILYFVDNDINKDGIEFCGITILYPQKISEIIFDKVIITSQYSSEIAEQLYCMGIKNIYIFSYYIESCSYRKKFSIIKAKKLNFSNKDFNFKNFKKKKCRKNNLNSNIKYYKKNVLFFAISFPPCGGSGVQRSLKFVKYLRDYGYNPIVVTLDETYNFWGIDYSLLDELSEDIQIIRIKQPYLNVFEINEEKAIEILSLIYGVLENSELSEALISRLQEHNFLNRKYIFEPDIFIAWVNEVIKNINKLIDFKKIDVLYTTGDPYSNHLNGYYLKKMYNIPWIADFRDEWTNGPYVNSFYKNDNFKLDLHKSIENSIVNFADKVIAVTPNSSQNYRNIFNLLYDKVCTITNGYDEDDFNNIRDNYTKNEKFTILYYGTLYLNINLSKIIDSINNLIENQYIKKSEIIFKIIGKSNNLIKNSMLRNDKFGVLEFIDYLPHKKCLEEGAKSDILVLYVGEEDKFKSIYTGKVFEYLRLLKPIIAISPKNSEVEQLLITTKRGENFNATNYSKIKDFILNYYNNWKIGTLEELELKSIQKYERQELTRSLSKLFDEMN